MTAPAELVISVTQEDIAAGKPGEACLCPIARAVARLLAADLSEEPAVVGPSVLLAVMAGDDTTTQYDLPEEAATFIGRFDNGHTVKPFTFTARLAPAGAQ